MRKTANKSKAHHKGQYPGYENGNPDHDLTAFVLNCSARYPASIPATDAIIKFNFHGKCEVRIATVPEVRIATKCGALVIWGMMMVIKVSGMAKPSPRLGGMAAPSKRPSKVIACHETHNSPPEPSRW